MDWNLIDSLIINWLLAIYIWQILTRWMDMRDSEDEFFFHLKVWLILRGVKDV